VGGLAIAPFSLSLPFLPVIYVLAVGGLIAYEYGLKASGLAGNIVVAALTGAVFLFGGAAGGAIVSVVPFALMATLATFSREVIKDMEDVRGDVDRRTLPRMRGMGVAGATARGAVAAAIALSALPVVTFLSAASGAGIIYLALVAAADAMFVLSVLWLPERLHWEQSMSKAAMAVALLAFLGASFR